jgi:Patatin-like phospholipase
MTSTRTIQLDQTVSTNMTPPGVPLPPGIGQVVLVLQGGGALGAYQVGVYEALHESGIEPNWVIGTSIGAINASLIAGTTRRAVWTASGNSGAAFSMVRSSRPCRRCRCSEARWPPGSPWRAA